MEFVVANLAKHFTSLKKTGSTTTGVGDTVDLDKLSIAKPDAQPIPQVKLAETKMVHSPFGSYNRKMLKSGSGVSYGQPQFFSPVYTPINWQIPSRRREVYMWCRYWYENEPRLATAIDLYSRFPVTSFETECKDRYIKHYFDELNRKLDLDKWLRIISHEVHLLGDCYPFLEVECPHCGGNGRVGSNICEHPGGTFKRVLIMNPDFIEVFTNPLAPDNVITYLPDDELRDLVLKGRPGSEKMSADVKQMVAQGQPIPLDNLSVSHIKYGESGYRRYGISMIRRLFPILSYKTKIMTAQWIVAERMIIPIKVVKVGSDERPASDNDIAAVQSQLMATSNDPNLCLVTHHAFDLEWFGACHSEDTEVLTENGWKHYSQVLPGEKIATYNAQTGSIEFDVPQDLHEYDYDGDLVHFKSRHYDVLVTPNHMMLASMREWNNDTGRYAHGPWEKVRADNIIENSRFLSTANWEGSIPERPIYRDKSYLSNLSLDEYLEFVGFYVSEGGVKRDKGVLRSWSITQTVTSPCFLEIKSAMSRVADTVREAVDDRRDDRCIQFYVDDSKFSEFMAKEFGDSSVEKRIPHWILSLPKRELAVVLTALMKGDGDIVVSASGCVKCRYSTVSKVLAGQVQEIALKLGMNPKISVNNDEVESHNDIYRVYWSHENEKNGTRSVKDRNISREHYSGKVWCFTTKSGFFVTRRNGKIGIHGNSGKILQVSGEYEFINQEILDGVGLNKQLITDEGPCYHPDVEILTELGWKDHADVEDGEKLATFNPKTGALEYQHFKNRIIQDFDGELVHFETNKLDMLVTPNHRMWISPRGWEKGKEGYYEWKVVPAEEVKHRARMRACIDLWEGVIPDEYSDGVDFGGVNVPLEHFVALLGYYLSEAYASLENGSVSQKTGTSSCERIASVFDSCGIPHGNWDGKNGMTVFSFHKPQRLWLMENTPGKAREKFIPVWVKNLPSEYLDILFSALIDGDGSIHSKQLNSGSLYRSYISGSKQLADDVMEIAFKLGYAPTMSDVRLEEEGIYVVNIPSSNIGRFPVLDTLINGNKSADRRKCISRVPYTGKVWCFEVPNEFLIVRYKGKPLVCGNTYSSAAMGAEIMIRRFESWRQELKRWVERRIYLPIARMRGFVEENEWGEPEYIYPKIKWDSLNLRDRQAERQMILNLYEKGLVSAKTTLQEFDIDPDAEFVQLRYERIEQAYMAQPGMIQGQGGEMGGGLGDLGIGGAGGGGGGLELGGGLGEPGMGGGMEGGMGGGMEGGMGGGAPAGGGLGLPGAASQQAIKTAQVDPSAYGGKLLTEKTRQKLDKEREKSNKNHSGSRHPGDSSDSAPGDEGFQRDERGRVFLTSIEKTVLQGIEERQKVGDIRYNCYPSLEVPVGDPQPVVIDLAFPDVRVGVECDGDKWHGSPDDVSRDKKRDGKLNRLGWIIMRFREKEIEGNTSTVLDNIAKTIRQREAYFMQERQKLQKKRDQQTKS